MNGDGRGALRLGRIAGIDIHVHWTFALLLGWVAWQLASAGHGTAAALRGVGFVLAVFGCVVLHELGHALTARRYGIGTRDITLYPIGGVARLEGLPDDPRQEMAIAVAGPAVNLLLSAAFAVALAVLGALSLADVLSFRVAEPVGAGLLHDLLVVNLTLAAFNLVPAFPMDGGRVLRALLSLRTDRVRATRIAATIGQRLAIAFGVFGLFFNPLLMFVALFVYLGAEQEARAVELQGDFEGARVRDAMLRRVRVFPGTARLRDAMEALLAEEQTDFPILDPAGHLLGMLERDTLIRGLAEGRIDEPCAPLATPAHPLAPDAPLAEALRSLQAAGADSGPVVADGAVVGLLTVQNTIEWWMVRRALSLEGQRPPRPPTVEERLSAAPSPPGAHAP